MDPKVIIQKIKEQCESKGIAIDAIPSPPDIFYDGTRFYYREASGMYVPCSDRSITRRIKEKGLCEINVDGKLSADPVIVGIQEANFVNYCGPISGYSAGLHIMNSRKVLVTESSRYVKPVEGDWGPIRELCERVLVTSEVDQTPFFYAWCQIFVKAYVDSILHGNGASAMPGQALCIAGAPGGGKTLLSKVVARIVGDFKAAPHGYMTGKTEFNGDSAGASILLIDDKLVYADSRARSLLGSMIKEVVVAAARPIRGMYKETVLVIPVQRLVILMNDEPDNLNALPLQDNSMSDKIILLKAEKRPMPLGNETFEGRKSYDAALNASLPGFMHFLLNEYCIPKELQSPRFGVCEFHHPALLKALQEMSPEGGMMEAIDKLIRKGALRTDGSSRGSAKPGEWVGSAAEFLAIVERHSPNRNDVAFRDTASTGTHLRKLMSAYPSRISSSLINGKTIWRIKAPPIQA